MNIELSEHFTYRKLLRFTFPSMVMMVLTSVYGVVDGFFISNFIGAEPFAGGIHAGTGQIQEVMDCGASGACIMSEMMRI